MHKPKWKVGKSDLQKGYFPITIQDGSNCNNFEIFMIREDDYKYRRQQLGACILMVRKYWPLIDSKNFGSVPRMEKVAYLLNPLGEFRTPRSPSELISANFAEINIPRGPGDCYDNKFEFFAEMLSINGFSFYRPKMEVNAI